MDRPDPAAPPTRVGPTGETAASDADTLTDAGRAAARSAPSPRIDTRVAHFRIDRLLGRGGMGEVYLATDLALERPVALKFLADRIADDPVLRERFLREARAQARVNHPNICHIYFIGEEKGRLFFAMEYIEGETVQGRLDREKKLPPSDAVELCRQAALGLREAQRHGFIHRDVKPSNLMVDRHGVVKVLDFGVAKGSGAVPDGGTAAGGALAETQAGTLLGTPLYMAPEQAKAGAVDFRADIYALGATRHHLVAGKPPFESDTVPGVLGMHREEARPRLVPGKRASPIDTLCDRMMAKRPEDRISDYDDLVTLLEVRSHAVSRPAGLFPRWFALMVDLYLFEVPGRLIDQFTVVNGSVVAFGLMLVYFAWMQGRFGRTVGEMTADLEVVDVESGRPPSYGTAALRGLSQFGGLIIIIAVVNLFITKVSFFAFAGVGSLLWMMGHAVGVEGDPRPSWDRRAGTLVRYRSLALARRKQVP